MALARSDVRSRAVAERPVVRRSISIVPVRGSVAAWKKKNEEEPISVLVVSTKTTVTRREKEEIRWGWYLVEGNAHEAGRLLYGVEVDNLRQAHAGVRLGQSD
jgi:hypothetical protein